MSLLSRNKKKEKNKIALKILPLILFCPIQLLLYIPLERGEPLDDLPGMGSGKLRPPSASGDRGK